MSDSTFNILSFDGGGIRGALSIKLLEIFLMMIIK